MGDEEDEDVRRHAFLGNWEMVVQSLRVLPGFMDVGGVVECGGVMRCESSGMVNGFLPPWVAKVEVMDRLGIGRQRVAEEVY
jgi:hypothetical protein